MVTGAESPLAVSCPSTWGRLPVIRPRTQSPVPIATTTSVSKQANAIRRRRRFMPRLRLKEMLGGRRGERPPELFIVPGWKVRHKGVLRGPGRRESAACQMPTLQAGVARVVSLAQGRQSGRGRGSRPRMFRPGCPEKPGPSRPGIVLKRTARRSCWPGGFGPWYALCLSGWAFVSTRRSFGFRRDETDRHSDGRRRHAGSQRHDLRRGRAGQRSARSRSSASSRASAACSTRAFPTCGSIRCSRRFRNSTRHWAGP